jgi:hypothetical protein
MTGLSAGEIICVFLGYRTQRSEAAPNPAVERMIYKEGVQSAESGLSIDKKTDSL